MSDIPLEEKIAARQADPAPAVDDQIAAEARTRNLKLDRKRPYGTCHGFEEGRPVQSKYRQDGLYFDNDGNVIPGIGNYQARVEQAARPKVKITLECEIDAEGNPILPDLKADAERKKEEEISKKGAEQMAKQGGQDIDLHKWASNEEYHPYFMVRAKIMTLYGKDLKAAHDARDFILNGDFLKTKKVA